MKWIKMLKDYDDTHKKGAVIEVEDAAATVLVKGKYAEETANPEATTQAEAMKELGDTLIDSFKTLTKRLKNFTTPRKEKRKNAKTGVEEEVEVDELGEAFAIAAQPKADLDVRKMHNFRNLGEFTKCVIPFQKGRVDDKLRKWLNACDEEFGVGEGVVKAATGMNESDGTDGGLLVPTDFSDKIYEKVFPEEDLAMGTDKYTTSGNGMQFRVVTEDSRADGFRHGGVRGYWMEEAEQFTKSKFKLEPMVMRLKKVGALLYVTDELNADAQSLTQYSEKLVGKELRFQVNNALIHGTGDTSPMGVLAHAGSISVNRTTASKVKYADIKAMWIRMFAPWRTNAVWLFNQEVEPQLWDMHGVARNAADSENVGGWPVYMPPGINNAQTAWPYGTLMGRPAIPCEFCPALGTKGDLILIDWAQYITLTKGTVVGNSSMHVRFEYDETAYKWTLRMDGQPWVKKAFSPFKGSNTLSSTIVLN